MSFKFHFNTKQAFVSLDLEDDLENRILVWQKLETLKSILLTNYLPEAIFEEVYFLENGKEISRVYVTLNKKASIHNKSNWQDVMIFFNETMNLFEVFFEDYQDVIDS